VTAKQVMKIILIQKKLQARTIEENTIIIFPDNETTARDTGNTKSGPQNRTRTNDQRRLTLAV